MTDTNAQEIQALQEWAKQKFGEREYIYFTREHRWQTDRTRTGRAKSTGRYYTACMSAEDQPRITKEEYEAKVKEGEQHNLDAFMGRRQGSSYLTYERKQTKDGWQDYLMRMVTE